MRIYDDTAVVSYPYDQQANVRGLDITGDFLITDVWIKRSNKWQVSLRLILPLLYDDARGKAISNNPASNGKSLP